MKIRQKEVSIQSKDCLDNMNVIQNFILSWYVICGYIWYLLEKVSEYF